MSRFVRKIQEVSGRYRIDGGYINLFSDNTIYTIPRNNLDRWGAVKVGEPVYLTGQIMTQDIYNSMLAGAKHSGTFVLRSFE